MTRSALVTLALAAGVTGSAATQAAPDAPGARGARPAHPRLYAQQLVEEALAAHPEVTGVELAAVSAEGCRTIAATDLKEVGEKCDEAELGSMRSSQAHVEQETDGFDITVPLHDTAGRVIGAIGMDFRPEPGQTASQVVERSWVISREIASRVASKAQLFAAPAAR